MHPCTLKIDFCTLIIAFVLWKYVFVFWKYALVLWTHNGCALWNQCFILWKYFLYFEKYICSLKLYYTLARWKNSVFVLWKYVFVNSSFFLYFEDKCVLLWKYTLDCSLFDLEGILLYFASIIFLHTLPQCLGKGKVVLNFFYNSKLPRCWGYHLRLSGFLHSIFAAECPLVEGCCTGQPPIYAWVYGRVCVNINFLPPGWEATCWHGGTCVKRGGPGARWRVSLVDVAVAGSPVGVGVAQKRLNRWAPQGSWFPGKWLVDWGFEYLYSIIGRRISS